MRQTNPIKKSVKTGLTAILALLLTAIPTPAEVVPEVSIGGGYTDNLFSDSSSLSDTYTAVSPLFKIYPSATTEIVLGGTYQSYFDNTDLSNLSGNAGITIIPDLKDSKLHLMFSGDVSGRSYGDLFELYNSYSADVSAMFSFGVSEQVTLRGGSSAGTSQYSNSISGDSKSVGLFGGINCTPFGSNSLNFEAGIRFQEYVTGLDTLESGGRRPSSSIQGETSDFQVASFSVRYSRPLGLRTGANAFYSERWFVKEADSIIYGFSVDYLSPWTSMWDGRSFGANIKNFPGADFIIESGFNFIDKQYVKNLEIITQEDGFETILQQREDERLTVYLSLQRPFKASSGMLVKPSLQVRWVDNSSNLELYDCSYADVNLNILFSF